MLMLKQPTSFAVIVGTLGLSGLAACSSGGKLESTSTASSTSSSTSSSTAMSQSVSSRDPYADDPTLRVDDESSTTGTQIHLTAVALPSGEAPGAWYAYGSDPGTNATLTPPAGVEPAFTALDAGPFPHAACVSSSGFDGAFAGEGFYFATVEDDAGQTLAAPVDFSAFSGFTFWAMSTTNTWIRVNVPDDQTFGLDPTAACHGVEAGGSCDDDFSQDNETLTGTWTQFLVYFLNLSQNNFGAQFYTLDTQNLFGVQFQVEGSEDGGAIPFQFCVSQIALFR
jgi:hypothetical protein